MQLHAPVPSVRVQLAGRARLPPSAGFRGPNSPSDDADELQRLKAELLRSEHARQEAVRGREEEARGREAAELRAKDEARGREAAERRAADEARGREAAERRAADEARSREAAERRAEEAERLFLADMKQLQAAEKARRWAQSATRASLLPAALELQILRRDEAAVLSGLPLLPADVQRALTAARSKMAWPAIDVPERDAYKRGSVHNAALALLLSIEQCIGPTCLLRRHYEESLDSRSKPDFSYTGRHEASVTLLSSLISMELKAQETLSQSRSMLLAEGYVQGFRNGASRVLQLQARFPAQQLWEAFVVVSNMDTLCVMRVVLSREDFVVCCTADEPLRTAPNESSLPRGVELLARLLCASPSQLGGMFCSPPDMLLMLPDVGGDDGGAAEAVAVGHLVGSGGYCDVFSAVWRGAPCALKLPRSTSDPATLAALRREASALRRLARAASPHVPQLLSASTLDDGAALLLQPLGTVAAEAPGAASPAGTPQRARLAEACARGVLAALRAARAARLLHRDVRPSNVLWHEAGGCVQLIDWGISRTQAANLRALQPAALGWPDTAPDAALHASARSGPPWLPSPATDCESAVYTLAAIAFGEPCGQPPWAAAADAAAVAQALAAGQAAAEHGPAAQDAAMTAAVIHVRLEARRAWFAALPPLHPLARARADALLAQQSVVGRAPRLPSALPPGWADALRADG